MTIRLIIWLLCYSGCAAVAVAQSKHDYIWMLGTERIDSVYKLGGCRLDFNEQPVHITHINIKGETLPSYHAMSDVQGRLLYYTNGCNVYNTDYEVMEGGDSLNAGVTRARYCGQGLGYPSYGISLPYPGKSDTYLYLHSRLHDSGGSLSDLYQTIIDMNANSGKGRVVDKNILLRKDSFNTWPAAVRHANGRDWWIVVNRAAPPTGFHLFLVTPDGVQDMGVKHPDNKEYNTWLSRFSSDGTKFCYSSFYPFGVGVFDFDRGTGKLFNSQFWNPPFDSVSTTTRGVEMSPNSKYLYVTTGARLWQYDLRASDIEKSGEIVYEAYKPGEPALLVI